MSRRNLRSFSFLIFPFLLAASFTGCGDQGSPSGTTPPPPVSWRGTQQYGTTGNDVGRGIVLDSSANIYITGSTEGVLGASAFGLSDIFLAKFDSSGNQLFIKQLGTTGFDIGYGVALDSSGNVYVTGSTEGTLGASAFGLSDIFLAKFDSSGNNIFIQQLGTTGRDIGYGITLDSSANAFITGSTEGILGASALGLSDIFLAKFNSSGVKQ